MMADQLRYDAQGAVWKGANTPNLDKLAASGARFMKQYSSTPTCTPARAGILTGQSPWNHGMLGYGAVAPVYPFEMPVALRAVGYTTASIGKDHFGWDSSKTLPPLLPKYDAGDKGSGTPHGYERMSLYDGLVGQEDEYHQWFEREMPGHEAEEGWPTLNMNGWMGAPFVFAVRSTATVHVSLDSER
jgi:arylsulfatase